MKIAWLLGWAVPEEGFAALARGFLPRAVHTFAASAPDALARLEETGPFDWVVGYSLGAQLLLAEPARAARLGPVRLMAPIFAFPLESQLGGKISRAELRLLSRTLDRDLRGALEGFYGRIGLDVPTSAEVTRLSQPKETDRLRWGLGQLENQRIEPPMPAGWRGWCGQDDPLLDAGRLHALDPAVTALKGATHHPLGLIRPVAEEVMG